MVSRGSRVVRSHPRGGVRPHGGDVGIVSVVVCEDEVCPLLLCRSVLSRRRHPPQQAGLLRHQLDADPLSRELCEVWRALAHGRGRVGRAHHLQMQYYLAQHCDR